MAKTGTMPSNRANKRCISYLFTPPYLFIDLSNVHERAFGEFIAAYKEQVKRNDFSDLERIDTFRLRVLSIILTAADWVGPIKGAVADTVHLVK